MGYTNQQIAAVVGAPLENVLQTWPACLDALIWQGINDNPTRIALVATIAVETWITVDGRNMTFLPISEIGGPSARYAPWYGRGLIQCTWESNYAAFGPRMRPPRDCVADPDVMLETIPSAQFAALYFADRGIPGMARAGNWVAVREAVNGGLNGWIRFKAVVDSLLALPEPPDAPPVTTVANPRGTILRRVPVSNAAHAKGTDHPDGLLPAGTVVRFCPDPSPGPYHGQETTPHWAHCTVAGGPMHGWAPRSDLQTTGA